MRAVVTAGGTSEPIDDVRVVTNSSTGRMGAAIANALVERGVQVTLLASNGLASHPHWLDPRIEVVPFGSFLELAAALDAATEPAPDLLFMAAAVSDYAPVRAAGKIRSNAEEVTIRMVRNPKLLPTLRSRCGDQTFLCGFKLLSGVSSEELIEVARHQIDAGRLNLCLANDLQELLSGSHPAWLVPATGEPVRVEGTKAQTAAALVDLALAGKRLESLPSDVVDLEPPADEALLDALVDVLAAADHRVRTTRPEPFIERGWRPLGGLLEPPSRRDDLLPAASICLWHAPSNQVLLGQRTAGAYHGYWAFPGGGVDATDSSLQAAAVRELAEETGIVLHRVDAVLTTDLTVGHGERAWALHNVAARVEHRAEPQATAELDAEWVSLSDALTRRPMAAGTRRVLRRLNQWLAQTP